MSESYDNALTREGMMTRLWAGWRIPYIESDTDQRARDVPPGMSLFEAIFNSELPDETSYVLWRGRRCFAMLNAFPYTSGHLMVLPQRAAADLTDLDDDEYTELFVAVRRAVVALKAAYRPHGINVGLNLGEGSGAGFPEHLHVHCLPRWSGDTNFITTVAEARVLPESLSDTWRKLRAAWPQD
jgi:ATP adenylyltransferase